MNMYNFILLSYLIKFGFKEEGKKSTDIIRRGKKNKLRQRLTASVI